MGKRIDLVGITKEVLEEMGTEMKITDSYETFSERDGSGQQAVALEYMGTEDDWFNFEPGNLAKEIVKRAYSEIVSGFMGSTEPIVIENNGLLIYRTQGRGDSVIAQESDYHLYITVMMGLD